MALDIASSVVEYLKSDPDNKFTAKEIAQWIFDNNPKNCQKKLEKSSYIKTDADLIKKISREIYARNSAGALLQKSIKSLEGPPKRFYYTEKSDEDEEIELELGTGKDKVKISEEILYQKLSEFLWSEFAIYSKRIDEKKSKNSKGKDGNKWLYPDVVGVEDLSADWKQEIKDCASQYFDKKT